MPVPLDAMQYTHRSVSSIGRQLFVDDFPIESTTLKCAFHKLHPYVGNPILKLDRPWESEGQ